MIRVGWLADDPGYKGGAELTETELRAAAPEDVEIVQCRPGEVAKCDVYAIHNCLTYSLGDLKQIGKRAAFKYWNDVGNWYPRDMRVWLDRHATAICCSKLQARHMGLPARLIPPPVNLERFEQAATSVNGDRRGTVSVAAWRAQNKGPNAVMNWASQHGEHVDFFGGGPFAPAGSREVAYQGMPGLLSHYQRFVFLPQVIEPFGRLVAEAWAAGCELVVNRLVGAIEWIDGNPDAIRTAASDYWKLVLDG